MGNWYCSNCKSWEDSWAEYPKHKPTELYCRYNKCRKCNRHKLIYTDSQKTRYKGLVKERTDIPGYIEEVERFGTWWNNNLATAVAYYDGYYRVFLLVYDSAYSTYEPAKFPVDKDCNYWGDHRRKRGSHNCLSDARDEAEWLRGKVDSCGKYSDNPILLIHPYCDCSRSFEDLVKEPYVTKIYSTSYLKPFDVVKTYTTRSRFGFDFSFYHVGVYLGKIDEEFKVCQFTREENSTTIDEWSKFVEGKVIGYHPVIPFKNYEDMS